ncbi:MAG: 2-oxo acid dehydrogenase subunit E2 [Candidatus Latescibacteria bacterium]|nr:2-oxo acid dehydrogenase subunit E2 [Candidatus Latescibacterota bacterium]
MAVEIVLPRLGWTMEEGTLVEWLKKDGDPVQAGEVLFTVESDKAVNEIESFDAGVLRIPPDSPPPGSTVPVGTLLAYILAPGEALPAGRAASAPAAAAPAPAATASAPAAGRHEGPRISPRARRLARQLGVDWSQLQGSGQSGRLVERDIQAASRTPRVSPVARRMAQEAGVDLGALAAAKPGARLQRQDVEAALATQTTAPAAGTSTPLSSLRRIIAQRMGESSRTTAAVTLFAEADASELVELRQRFKEALAARQQQVPSYNDFFLKLTALALSEHPQLNASWQGDTIQAHTRIDIGMAVDTEAGLLVPVLRQVDRLSLQELAAQSAALSEGARTRRLKAEQLQGATFTVTNLGMYHIDAFTPIIDLPQCAILGIGRIALRPAVHQGQVVPRHQVVLSLSFDHRVVDGGPAARFLDAVRQYVEQPHLWLAR